MRILALLAVLTLAACASAPEAPPAPSSGLEEMSLPAYDSDRAIGWASSREDYDAAAADARFALWQFTYPSDGLTVGAYVYAARTPVAKKSPVIVFNRGSFVRQGFAGEMLVMARRYAEAGFIVVAPHYRGSNGWPGKDELGGADLHDLLNIVPALARLPGADTSRLFLAGESRGGAMVYMALREGFPARAAAVWGAFTDLESLVAPGATQEKAARYVWPDFAERRDEIIRTRSAIRWAERIDVPVLIMHGSADDDIPLAQSQRMDAELTRLGKPHEFIVFEGEKHVLGGKAAERDAAAVEWFRQYGAQ